MDLELLTRLTETFGPSGFEDEIREVIREAVAPLADELWVDPLGSLVVRREGTGAGQKVVLAAHMDEIGVMVTHIDKEGFLRFTRVGYIHPYTSIGARVRFANGTLGVVYLERQEDASKPPTLDELYIDVGATQKEEVPVKVGDPAVFVRPLLHQRERIVSKTLDDRVGCYILIELLRRLEESPHDLYFVFSVQEEITLSGARTSAYKIEPDLAIAVDVTGTGDTPKAVPMAVEMGKGPAIKVKDAGMIAHPRVRKMLVEAAQRAGVPYQLEILRGGTTDAAVMQLVRAGVPSGCVSVPCRFIHSPSEMVDVQDVEQTIALLFEALSTDLPS